MEKFALNPGAEVIALAETAGACFGDHGLIALGEDAAWRWIGNTVKAGRPETKGAAGFMDFACRRGDEPTDHIHDGEDEIFVLLEGAMTVRCGEDEFEVAAGDFVFLPRNVPHGFTIRTDHVRMFVVTAPDDFSRRIEGEDEPVGDGAPD